MTTDKPLTTLGTKVIEILSTDTSAWYTRRQIANALGRKRLSEYDVGLLQNLVECGLIEESQRPITTARNEFIYRIKQQQ